MTDVAVTLDLATSALRLEHLQARLTAINIARLGAGSPTLFAARLEDSYRQLQEASPAAAAGMAAQIAADASTFAGVHTLPVPADASADDLILQLTRSSSRYQALADGIGRQYSLMTLAIRGAR